MPLVILGGGESGTGAALLAKKKGLDLFVSDSGNINKAYKQLLIAHDIPFEEGGHTMARLRQACEVIKSPGIPRDATIVNDLHRCGIPIIDEIEFAARYTKAKIIAITGSNGKSTTAYLTYHLLKAAGLHVGLAGNVGCSFAKSLTTNAYDYYVLELSSFQLECINTFKAAIACLLNITPDHLNRYNYSMEAYIAAKWNIIRNMTQADHLIYNSTDASINLALAQQVVAPQLHPIPMMPMVAAPETVTLEENQMYNSIMKLASEAIPLSGPHNLFNAMAAATAAALVGVSMQVMGHALPRFQGLPHRLEWCGTLHGVDCYNDSKATNVASAAVALHSFNRPIVWIAGGQDKGNDYSTLQEVVGERVKAIICLGKDNTAIVAGFQPLGLPIQERDQLEAAVQMALSMAVAGDILLLSPACASFDLFKNFEDRGNQFKALIKRYCEAGVYCPPCNP